MASEATNTRERVPVADGPVPAPADENTAPLSLKRRFALMRNECAGIGKEDIRMEKDGKKWTIKGHTVEAVLSEVRPLLDRFDLDLTPNLIERAYSGNRCDVIVDFEFECLDTDEVKTIRWAGADTDNGGKAFAKAGTNALKEMLKKKFLITDRDDAKEETESVEHQTEDGLSKKDAEKLKEQRRKAIEQWAKTFKEALGKTSSVEDVTRLERDNREQLSSEDMPDVTRSFFVELIQKRKEAHAS